MYPELRLRSGTGCKFVSLLELALLCNFFYLNNEVPLKYTASEITFRVQEALVYPTKIKKLGTSLSINPLYTKDFKHQKL
jgi:hypothetical protein